MGPLLGAAARRLTGVARRMGLSMVANRNRLPLSVLGAALLLPLLFCLGAHGKGSGKQADPVWTFDLSPFGYSGEHREKPETFAVWPRKKGLAFTDAHVLAAYFVIRQPSPRLTVRRHPRATDPFQLRAIFLDTATGTVRHTQDWPTDPNSHSELLATYEGKFIVRAGESLALYSSSFQLLSEFPLPLRGENGKRKYWDAQLSPTGRFLFLRDWHYPQMAMFRLSSDSFEQRDAWSEQYVNFLAYADDALAKSVDETQVWFRTMGGPWYLLYVPGGLKCAGQIAFLNNHTFLVDVCLGIVVLSKQGEILFEDAFPREYRRYPLDRLIRTSRGGRRFAVSLATIKEGLFDTPFYTGSLLVIVYDARSRARIFRVEFKGHLKRKIYDVALSPDGKWLAIMVGTKVQVYQLPVP